MKTENAFEHSAKALAKVHELVLNGSSIHMDLKDSREQWKVACQSWEDCGKEVEDMISVILTAQQTHEQSMRDLVGETQAMLGQQSQDFSSLRQAMRDLVSETKAMLGQQSQDFSSLRSDALEAQSRALELGRLSIDRFETLRRTLRLVIGALVLLVGLCAVVVFFTMPKG